MNNIIGTIASILWAVCLVPELLKTISEKNCKVAWGTLVIWTVASVLSIIYTWSINSVPLFFNYSLNLIFQIILIIYKVKYK